MIAFNPKSHFWTVGGDEAQVYSSAQRAYVASEDGSYQAWLSSGGLPTRIRNEVELQDMLLKHAPLSALARTFTAAEIVAALLIIDEGKMAAAFTAEELAEPTSALAARLQTVAASVEVLLGEIV